MVPHQASATPDDVLLLLRLHGRIVRADDPDGAGVAGDGCAAHDRARLGVGYHMDLRRHMDLLARELAGAVLARVQFVGWIVLESQVSTAGVRYMALFFTAVGTFPQMSNLMGWLSANLRGRNYLAVGMAGFGNCANFVAST